MRFLWRWLKRLVLLVLLMAVGLLLPVGYIELACKGDPVDSRYAAILPEDWQRPESRTLLTYPEWHIVHTYDDYAEVIATGDPHDFNFLRAITGFWTSLCALSETSAQHGGFPWETRQMVYTIGVSFTAEMLGKAAYEETFGRAATMIRGTERSALDLLSADQARAYAQFLQQVPWYKWNFTAGAADLATNDTGSFRDTERRIALGLEYRAKAAYAGVIAQAVAAVGADALRLRMVVTAPAEALTGLDGVTVISQSGDRLVIETPRYRELTYLMQQMADRGTDFIEIAGNDDILLTATSPGARASGAIHSFARQGYGDYRHLILVKVADLAETLRQMRTGPLQLEHIHDY